MSEQVAVATGGRVSRGWVATPGRWLLRAALAFFLLNIAAIVATVVLDSFGTRWFGGWAPHGYTSHYYSWAWQQFGLPRVLFVTGVVAVGVAVIALLIGAPAAYILARRSFPGKRVAWAMFLLPLLVPPVTYGIPLATLLYRLGIGGSLLGVLVANLVPSVPLVVLALTPYVEQIDPTLEGAARACGARTSQVFRRVLAPLLLPGLLSAGLLVLVQTIGMFELSFFTAGPTDQTLVVALYYALWAPGIRPPQAIDAMAVIYMLLCLALLFTALRFVSPTQMVAQVKDNRK
jgi:putative spermidine/putrescine transport system permease protein